MSNQSKDAFEFARDTTKQFITLATGILALTITFAKDFVVNVSPLARNFVISAWITFLISVFFGLWTLMALTGSFKPRQESSGIASPPSIYSFNVIVPSALQILSFLIGLTLTVAFGVLATPG